MVHFRRNRERIITYQWKLFDSSLLVKNLCDRDPCGFAEHLDESGFLRELWGTELR